MPGRMEMYRSPKEYNYKPYPGVSFLRSRSKNLERNLKMFHTYFNEVNPDTGMGYTFKEIGKMFNLSPGSCYNIINFLCGDLYSYQNSDNPSEKWDLTDTGLYNFTHYMRRYLIKQKRFNNK